MWRFRNPRANSKLPRSAECISNFGFHFTELIDTAPKLQGNAQNVLCFSQGCRINFVSPYRSFETPFLSPSIFIIYSYSYSFFKGNIRTNRKKYWSSFLSIDQSSEYNQTKVWKHVKTTRFFLSLAFSIYLRNKHTFTESENIQDLHAFLLNFPVKGGKEIFGDCRRWGKNKGKYVGHRRKYFPTPITLFLPDYEVFIIGKAFLISRIFGKAFTLGEEWLVFPLQIHSLKLFPFV